MSRIFDKRLSSLKALSSYKRIVWGHSGPRPVEIHLRLSKTLRIVINNLRVVIAIIIINTYIILILIIIIVIKTVIIVIIIIYTVIIIIVKILVAI